MHHNEEGVKDKSAFVVRGSHEQAGGKNSGEDASFVFTSCLPLLSLSYTLVRIELDQR